MFVIVVSSATTSIFFPKGLHGIKVIQLPSTSIPSTLPKKMYLLHLTFFSQMETLLLKNYLK